MNDDCKKYDEFVKELGKTRKKVECGDLSDFTELKINEKRFEYNKTSGYITDNITGKQYNKLSEITKLLNNVNDRADKNAELLTNEDDIRRRYAQLIRKEIKEHSMGSATFTSKKWENEEVYY